MPLLGHAFTGMATALIVGPYSSKKSEIPSFSPVPFLTTTLVIFSYLPDIVSQCCLYFDWYDGRLLAHSILFAFLFSPAAGLILNRLTSFTKKQCFLLAFTTIMLHDLLDILQSTDRQPLWPFSTTLFGNGITIIPHNPTKEALLFGCIYCLVLSWYLFQRRGRKSVHTCNHMPPFRQKWSERILIGTIILIVLATYHLRVQRTHSFQQAMFYFHHQDYSNALRLINMVDKWPRIAKPGRLDYLRGVIYMQQHRPVLAEKYLLLSYNRNQNFFWCIGDLALLYAKTHKTHSQRIALTEPYLRKMRNNFSHHQDFSQYMQKIQLALASRHPPQAAPAITSETQ